MKSRGRRPRNRSGRKLGAAHSVSRAASATSRAWAARPRRSGAVAVVAMSTSAHNLSALTGPRVGGDCASPEPRSLPMRRSLPLAATLAWFTSLAAQAPRPSVAPSILVKAGRLIDGRGDTPRAGGGILIDGDRIKAVGPLAQVQAQAKDARVIDLAQMTGVTGFIENHTHPFVQR